jgi:type VI protein secretion system component VasF
MAGHKDARYIPPRRERDRSSRRWRDRAAVWFALAAVAMVVVALFIGARYLSYS